jgi:hypothetical protein
MLSLMELLFIAAIFVALLMEARKMATRRGKLKQRSNQEFDQEIEISRDELELRLGESELMYEDLESTYWMHVSALVAISTHLYWHNWYLSLAMFAALAIIGVTFLSLKPFTTSIHDR